MYIKHTTHALLLILIALAVVGCSTMHASPTTVSPRVSIDDLVIRAYQAKNAGDQATASTDFDRILKDPSFARLAPGRRYSLLHDAARTAYEAGRTHNAHALFVRACGYPMAESNDWRMRLITAMQLHDDTDQALSLTRIAQHWTPLLNIVFPGLPLQLHRRLQRAHANTLDRDLLNALFDAGWPRHVDGGDYLWRDLALIELRHDRLKRATQVARYVANPSLVLSMRVDKRFDPIQHQHPGIFDLKRLVTTQLRHALQDAKDHPDQLAPIQLLQNLYLDEGKPWQALKVSDPVLSRVKKGKGAATYTDFQQKYNWILDNRARAYGRLGQWKRSLRTMETAAGQSEFGNRNVSQVINLAGYYARLNQPDNAAMAITALGSNVSPYGQMQLERVRFYIAYDRGEKIAMKEHMHYLREHRKLAIGTWQTALLLNGDMDEAAHVLIERLRNPDWRSDALLDVQDYPSTPMTFIGKRLDTLWAKLEKRKDVRDAVSKVGRMERVKLPL